MDTLFKTFERNLGTLTPDEQQALQKATVAVIGCGGLGGYVIEELARVGVGKLLVADPDHFSVSNLNRQVNACSSTLNRNKALVAAERVQAIHNHTVVQPFPVDFRAVPVERLRGADVLVDCLDDIQVRRDLSVLANQLQVPLVHGAVNGWFGQVGVQMPTYDLFALIYPQRGDCRKTLNPPSVLSFTVALIASLQAAETVKLLLRVPSQLHNRYCTVDLKDNEWILF
ncbi:HesA/MoeB/ThiF family protein [Desulfogranum japonicum]|uniref:HesA/MoeB/ThiF family protein n=1 Tax=Desulfogranum japonicum TaxID=231447 RepID=UPI00041064A9|nr:HesA/MoeB/ThiF family protein [Desulfogranum japonicum]